MCFEVLKLKNVSKFLLNSNLSFKNVGFKLILLWWMRTTKVFATTSGGRKFNQHQIAICLQFPVDRFTIEILL